MALQLSLLSYTGLFESTTTLSSGFAIKAFSFISVTELGIVTFLVVHEKRH